MAKEWRSVCMHRAPYRDVARSTYPLDINHPGPYTVALAANLPEHTVAVLTAQPSRNAERASRGRILALPVDFQEVLFFRGIGFIAGSPE